MILRSGSTEINLSFSFVALTVVMLLICNEEIVFCSFVSSFIHECGHLFFMVLSGEKPKKIMITVFGMRIDCAEMSRISYNKEILIALGGIIFNIIFGVAFFTAYEFRGNYHLMMISAVNFLIAAVNSVPVSALDLGRAVRCFFRYKEFDDRYPEMISYVCTAVFVVLSVLYVLRHGINISLIVINLYLIFITVIKKWS